MNMERPRGLFVTGTDTEVGKSLVAGGLAAVLREDGIDVGVMKPAETGCAKDDGRFVASDAEFLRFMAGVSDPVEAIVPYTFREPLAPAVAAEAEGVGLDVEDVVKRFAELAHKHEFMIVEGAGGLMVPFSGSFMMIDLIKRLELAVLIVGRAHLGTINHTLLTVRCAQAEGIEVKGIVLNNLVGEDAGPAMATNPEVIASHTDVPVLGVVPYLENVSPDVSFKDRIVRAIRDKVNWKALL